MRADGSVLLEELPALGNRRRQRGIELVAVLGILDRRRDELAPRDPLAGVAAIEQVEAGHDARDVRGDRAIAGAGGEQRVVARGANRHLILVVDRDRLGHALEVEHGHPVAADSGSVRLDDAERERHGDRGVDDVAALFEGERAGARRQRMARHDDGPVGDDEGLDERLLGDHRVDGGLERGLVPAPLAPADGTSP